MLQTVPHHPELSVSPQGSALLRLFSFLVSCLHAGFGFISFIILILDRHSIFRSPPTEGPADRQRPHIPVPSNPPSISVKNSPLVKILQQLHSVLLIRTKCRQ